LLPAITWAHDLSLAKGKRAQLMRLHFERYLLSAFAVAVGGKADIGCCTAHVRF